jgi:hypothetical protein
MDDGVSSGALLSLASSFRVPQWSVCVSIHEKEIKQRNSQEAIVGKRRSVMNSRQYSSNPHT